MARSNRDILAEYAHVMWNQHDVERGRTYMTPAFAASDVMHHLEQLFAAFSDLRAEILEPGVIGDGDLLAARILVSGTHDSAPFAGVPPSGRHLQWESIRIFRFEDGKIAQTWAMQDRLGLMEQLGAIRSTADEVNWGAGGR